MQSRRLDFRIKVYGQSHKKVVFFFCPFGLRRWVFLFPFLPLNRLIINGYQVVCYDFNVAVGKENPQKSLRVLELVYRDVCSRVKEYTRHGITDMSCFGISMGTLFASYSAAHISGIKNVILNLSYGDIAQHVADFPGMPFLPRRAIDQYIASAGGLQSLTELVKDYSPVAYADKLSKKRVLLYLARKDEVLQYDNSVQLKKLLEQYQTDLTYVENQNFKHYISGSINNFKGDYMDFLRGD